MMVVGGLPSSLMKLGESLVDTAKRKIQEEIGLVISDLQLLSIVILNRIKPN